MQPQCCRFLQTGAINISAKQRKTGLHKRNRWSKSSVDDAAILFNELV
jgi:hypothetical protein